MHPVLRLVRVNNVAVSFAGTVVGGLVAAGHGVGLAPLTVTWLALAAGSASLVTAGGNVLNDVLDMEGDRVNHPDRPLVTGAVPLVQARRLAAGLLVASLGLAVPVAWGALWVGVIWGVAVAALLAYEFRFKARGLLGNALVGFLTAALFLYGGAAVGAPAVPLLLAAMAFGATLSREVIKDMEDAAGDTGRATLPRVHGMGTAAAAARAAVIAAIVLSFTPYLTFLPLRSPEGIIYLALVLASDALFVASVVGLPRGLHRAQTVSKGAMTVALLAFLAAAFR